jgi:hypothetical protein
LAGWLAPLFGGTAWPASVDPNITDFIWEMREPFNLRDAFFAPGRLTIELEGVDYYLNPALMALPLWLIFVRDRTLNWLVIPALTYLFILLAILPSPNPRYLIPAIVPLTIAVSHSVIRLSERFLSPAAGRLLLILLTCLALVPSANAARLRLTRTPVLDYLAGQRSADVYIASHSGPAFVEIVNLANEQLDPESKILMLFESRGFYFEVDVIQDVVGINWLLLTNTTAPDACLAGTGISHLLVSVGSFGYYVVSGGLDPERLGWSAFQSFAANCLEIVYTSPALMLFEIRAPADEAEPLAPASDPGG